MDLTQQIQNLFGLQNPQLEHLNVPVNDVVAITTPRGTFALKIYNIQSRSTKDVQWELDLVHHLATHGAPVVKPVRGKHGYVETLNIEGQQRAAALFEWARGEKPKAGHRTYVLLGEAAARIHTAADSFRPAWKRETYDASQLIDEQIRRMKAHLLKAQRYDDMIALGKRLKALVGNPDLDQGICHMDLTLDNIHIHENTVTVFDFDSAGWCWRAIEPYGVLRFSQDYFNNWLEGYRSVRPFSAADEKAVAVFGIIGDIRNVVWKLGEARSSRGEPLLTAADLPKVIDDWLLWEQEKIQR
jgi:Ser/Thr protein kinase RdoA (MazF antagonist)